jgi:hypothetical protein
MQNKKMVKRGRPPGSPNKVTKNIREKFEEIIEKKSIKISNWLDKVADEDPAKAIELITRMAEYVVPKLNKVGIEGEIGITEVKIIELPYEEAEVEDDKTRKLAVNDD